MGVVVANRALLGVVARITILGTHWACASNSSCTIAGKMAKRTGVFTKAIRCQVETILAF